jgi:hypothetical protein
MQLRRILAGGVMAGALFALTVGSVGAADVSYTPSTLTYGGHGTVKATGLTPKGSYVLQIYNGTWVPLIPGGIPFVADASGGFTATGLDPDQTDLPGSYQFEITTADGKFVARTSPTLTGTNTYYVQHRLGA